MKNIFIKMLIFTEVLGLFITIIGNVIFVFSKEKFDYSVYWIVPLLILGCVVIAFAIEPIAEKLFNN